MAVEALLAVLLRPEVIAAISSATEVFVRDTIRAVFTMSEEELTAFIAQQEERKRQHDEWLAAHQPKP